MSRGLVDEVLADDVDRASVDEIPGVDPVVPADVQVEQVAAPLNRCLPVARLPVHDADGADPDRMIVALEQLLDLGRRHGLKLLGQLEDLTHPDARIRFVTRCIPQAERREIVHERPRRSSLRI